MRGAPNPHQSEDAETALKDARAFGWDDESIDNLRAELIIASPVADTFIGVWPENVSIVEAFLSVATQWRVSTAGGGFVPSRLIYRGLDYGAVRASLDAEAISVTPELWRGLRAMEVAAVTEMNRSE